VVTSLYGDYVYVVRPAPPPAAATAPTDGGAAAADAATTPEAAPERLVVNQVFVKLGRRALGRIEIREGLAAGDQVVTAGQNRLFNGMPVIIDNTINPAGNGVQAAVQ
jgi:membrane fusion protein (multidrug efflux system)